MPDRVETFRYTLEPDLNFQLNPLTFSIFFPPGWIRALEVVIPDGHAGLTGIALGHAGNRIFPRYREEVGGGDSFFQGNNEVLHVPVTDPLNTGELTVSVFNEDRYMHSFYLRIWVDELREAEPGFAPQFVG